MNHGSAPVGNPKSDSTRSDFALGNAGNDKDLLQQLASDIGELSRRLPADLRSGVEDAALKAAINGDYADVIGHVQDYLSARLTAPGD